MNITLSRGLLGLSGKVIRRVIRRVIRGVIRVIRVIRVTRALTIDICIYIPTLAPLRKGYSGLFINWVGLS